MIGTTPMDWSNQRLKNKSILIVEDSSDIRMLLSHVLSHQGATVSTAVDGQKGVEAATSQSFDAILMDLQMPVLSGVEAVAQMRQAQLQIPIIALTAHTDPKERERCKAAGFSDYLSKPVEFPVLVALLEQLMSPAPNSMI
jgi:CheY-like chemotaxis protein